MRKISKKGGMPENFIPIVLALVFGLVALIILFYYIFPPGWIDRVMSSIFG